jgi:pilus assembly protein CpaB
MKFAVGILTVLGILAAGSAALIVQGMRAGREIPTARVLILQGDLPAMTRLTADHVKLETVPRAALPQGCLINPVQAVGRILSVPLMKGQVLTESSLVARGAPAERMILLPPGMGVTTIAAPSRSVNGGLLYSGCFVDVLASIPAGPGLDKRTVSGTLFNAMQVWSIGDATDAPVVVEQGRTKSPSSSASGGVIKVNLLVKKEQAKILQMVEERGQISLLIRNPLEVVPSDPNAPIVADEDLRRALGLMPPEPVAVAPAVAQMGTKDVNEARLSKPPRIVQVIEGQKVKNEVFPWKDGENGRNQ